MTPSVSADPRPFERLVVRGISFEPALFCAPLAELTHSAFRRLLSDFGGHGGHFTEMLAGRQILKEDLAGSPSLKRRAQEQRVIYQLMLRPTDPVQAIVERLARVQPDGIDVNLACYAPVIRQLDAGSRLFENLSALASVLGALRRAWAGLLTVKIRLGHSTVGAEDRFIERLRVIEECGVDALTLHTRYFEDKFKRRAKHELFRWAGDRTRLPVIANGDIIGPHTADSQPEHFERVSGLMIGRMAVARPWIFAHWRSPAPIDFAEVWHRFSRYVEEDFPPVIALKRLQLFTTYYARNFHFGHTLYVAIRNARDLDDARVRAAEFFDQPQAVFDEPSMQGI